MRIARLFVALLLGALIVVGVSAQEEETPPILQILALVPDTARQGLVGYSDVRAAEQARPGAAQPESFAELMQLRDAEDDSANLWVGAFPGSGFGMAQYLLNAGETLPQVMGFDLLDIDRAVTFGEPPAVGDIFMGDFNRAAINLVLTEQGFVENEVNGLQAWCGEAGCDRGTQTNLTQRDPALLFGGDLGRKQPIVLTEDFLFSSADLNVIEAMTERAKGEKRSLAEVPEYQTAVKAMTSDPDTLLRQAYFVHPLQINPYGLTSSLVFEMLENTDMEELSDNVEEARAAIQELYGELPAYRLVAYADYADADYQYASVILVYEDVADAQTAVELIPQRIEIAQSTVTRRPLKTLLEERGAELTSPMLIEDEATGLSAAVFLWRYSHPATERGEMGLMPVPGLTFRLFQQQIFARDTMWLAYDIQ
jgi:hypothetical protein